MYCYEALANSFAEKATAALSVLRYKYSNDIKDLEQALPHLEKSVDYFKKLAELTKDTYLYANSMQTQQRKIPVGGNDGKMKTWVELLPVYENELNNFKKNIDSLRLPQSAAAPRAKLILKNAEGVTLITKPEAHFSIATGKELFTDTATYIKDFAEELKELNALKLSKSRQIQEGTELRFTNTGAVKVLVGYFNLKNQNLFLQPPQLETNATANDYGQAEIKIANAMVISGMPPVNIHTYSFKPGTNTLKLEKGACLILGFVDDTELGRAYDAGLVPGEVKKELDWLFD
jgi:hypothetical protein